MRVPDQRSPFGEEKALTSGPRLVRGAGRVDLSGAWVLAELLPELGRWQHELRAHAEAVPVWDLLQVSRLDSAAAVLLWRAWGERWPDSLMISDAHRQIFHRLADLAMPDASGVRVSGGVFAVLANALARGKENFLGIVTLFGQCLLDLAYLLRHPGDFPWREFSASIYKAGAQALPVTALVGFLIGITISYLSALQLRSFGADLFIVNILGISIIRELGPVLVAVLVAGRSGSAMTAQIGVMRVTEEIDALSTMGISRSLRIVLPKILALTLVMPLLVLWVSGVALLGGMLAALMQLDLSLLYFAENLPRAVPAANLGIGLGKGLAFGFVISLLACHFGLRVKPNTESLAARTTSSVVTAITLVILIDAVFAILTRQIGLPQL